MEKNMILWLVLGLALLISVYTLLLVWFFLKKMVHREKLFVIAKNGVEVLKFRLQAFERFTLLLERMLPESLILREQNINTNAFTFHSHLLKMVRHEFNHNIAMQVYIMPATWDKIKTARDRLLILINASAAKTNPESPSVELGRTIIEDASIEVNYHITAAINALRNEIEELYRF